MPIFTGSVSLSAAFAQAGEGGSMMAMASARANNDLMIETYPSAAGKPSKIQPEVEETSADARGWTR
jgi:hypothetical protein